MSRMIVSVARTYCCVASSSVLGATSRDTRVGEATLEDASPPETTPPRVTRRPLSGYSAARASSSSSIAASTADDAIAPGRSGRETETMRATPWRWLSRERRR